MIERVRFQNFRALRSVEVGLEPLTVIVGQNGSGKTSVLEGTHGIVELAHKRLAEVLDVERVRSAGWGRQRGMTLDEFLVDTTMALSAEGRWDGEPGRLELFVDLRSGEDSEQAPLKARLCARWADPFHA